MSEHTITVSGLRRRYGTGDDAFEAVRGIDLNIGRGTIHALLGVNGAGKTSTLEVIEGLASPTAGEVRVLGLDPIADRAAVRRRTGVLLQRSGFVADLTVAETVRMWAATVTDARPVAESLEMLGLADKAGTPMRALSGGEQRRVDLACTLSGRPDVVMLDEPTTGLDPESRRQVWRLVQDLKESGATVLLTTHYLEEAETLADGISIMRAGRIVKEGTADSIVADHPATISFATPDLATLDLATLDRALPDLTDVQVSRHGDLTTIETHDLQRVLTAVLLWAERDGVRLERISARSASLESVFLAIAQHGDDQHGDDQHESAAAAPDDHLRTVTEGSSR